jgi:hypothetical protein
MLIPYFNTAITRIAAPIAELASSNAAEVRRVATSFATFG